MSAWLPGEDKNLNETYGSWHTERDAEDALVGFVERTGAFRVYRQIQGRPFAQHHFQDRTDLRADVLLLPRRGLVSSGWNAGAIVLEVKRSGERIGPGCSQLMDYLNAAWPVAGGVAVVPTFGFLFPAHKQCGPIASIMAQQHIGTASILYGNLRLFCGESCVLEASETGEIHFHDSIFGRRMGTR